MKNKIKAPNSVTILVLTVLTILFWIGFEVVRAFTKTPEALVSKEILLPISPTLDSVTLSGLKKRVYLNEAEIGNIKIEDLLPQPSNEPAAVATDEGSPEGTQ